MKVFFAALMALLMAPGTTLAGEQAPPAETRQPTRPGAPPRPAAALTSVFSYTSPDGLISRRAGLAGEAALGAAAGLKLRATGEAAHIRSVGTGYFPGELYKTAFAVTAENRETRLAITLNSNSDRPLNSPSETDLGFNFTRTFSESGSHAWLWGIIYSTRRSFARGLPMPFISYRYASKDFFFLFPFIARWQASKTLAASASYQPVKYFRAALDWQPAGPLSAGIEGGVRLEQFFLAGRPQKNEALYCETTFISLRPVLSLSKQLRLGAELGWQFTGLYYTGKNYDSYRAKTRLGAGPALALSLSRSF